MNNADTKDMGVSVDVWHCRHGEDEYSISFGVEEAMLAVSIRPAGSYVGSGAVMSIYRLTADQIRDLGEAILRQYYDIKLGAGRCSEV